MPNEGLRSTSQYAPVRSGKVEWLLKAECRGTPMVDGVSIFFPVIRKSPGRPPREYRDRPHMEFYQEAIAICRRCSVIDECRVEYTRDPIPRDGMYFGKTPQQRKRIQAERNQEMLNKIRELVPYNLDYIEDSTTQEAKLIDEIHKVLYGVNIPEMHRYDNE